MSALDDLFSQALANFMQRLSDEAVSRVAALAAVRGVTPAETDAIDRTRLAHFILTGSGEFPSQEEMQRLEVRTMSGEAIPLLPKAYPYESGDVLVLGPEIFASTTAPAENTVISWQGMNFIPQRDQPEPAPAAGEHWRGLRGGRSG